MLAVNEDGSFRTIQELESLYATKGVTPDKEIITYCRIGERSSHSWFVLKYLLGYPNVKNYDGSWSEWGNSVKAPVERFQREEMRIGRDWSLPPVLGSSPRINDDDFFRRI